MNVCVTGGAGLIGHALVKSLCQHKINHFIIDNHSAKKAYSLPESTSIYRCDVRESFLLPRIFEREKPTVVVHLAAKTSVVESMQQPDVDLDNNVGGLLSVLHASDLSGVKKIIFASTAAVYSPHCFPVKVSSSVQPLSCYGLSKLAGESYVRVLCQQAGIDYAVLRFANIYSPYLTEQVVPQLMHAAVYNKPFHLHGDGYQRRDFLYIDDAVSAILQAILTSATGVYNIGTGISTTLNSLISTVNIVANTTVQLSRQPRTLADARYSCLDISETIQDEILDWRPKWSLAKGLVEVYARMRSSEVGYEHS